jgi:hypothetical protein
METAQFVNGTLVVNGNRIHAEKLVGCGTYGVVRQYGPWAIKTTGVLNIRVNVPAVKVTPLAHQLQIHTLDENFRFSRIPSKDDIAVMGGGMYVIGCKHDPSLVGQTVMAFDHKFIDTLLHTTGFNPYASTLVTLSKCTRVRDNYAAAQTACEALINISTNMLIKPNAEQISLPIRSAEMVGFRTVELKLPADTHVHISHNRLARLIQTTVNMITSIEFYPGCAALSADVSAPCFLPIRALDTCYIMPRAMSTFNKPTTTTKPWRTKAFNTMLAAACQLLLQNRCYPDFKTTNLVIYDNAVKIIDHDTIPTIDEVLEEGVEYFASYQLTNHLSNGVEGMIVSIIATMLSMCMSTRSTISIYMWHCNMTHSPATLQTILKCIHGQKSGVERQRLLLLCNALNTKSEERCRQALLEALALN